MFAITLSFSRLQEVEEQRQRRDTANTNLTYWAYAMAQECLDCQTETEEGKKMIKNALKMQGQTVS